MTAHDQVQPLLSPYLDGELTQGESQLVRIHLEDCQDCRTALDEMRSLQRMASRFEFPAPPDDRLDRIAGAPSVRVTRRIGWALAIAGSALWLGYLALVTLRGWRAVEPIQIITAVIAAGVLLLFLSVLRERRLEARRDPYRRIKR